MANNDLPPTTRVAPYKVLGCVPWGGKTRPTDQQRIAILPGQRGEVMDACRALIATGLAVAEHLDRESMVEAYRNVGPIDLLALEAGIRWYRDNTPGWRTPTQTWKEYRQEQRITATDVLHYTCRAAAWLLREMVIPCVPNKFPTDYDQMTKKVEELSAFLEQAGNRCLDAPPV